MKHIIGIISIVILLAAQTRIDTPTQTTGVPLAAITDCQVFFTSTTVITVKAPCTVKTNGIITKFGSGATVTLSATNETGTARFGFDTTVNPPVLTVRLNGVTTGNTTCVGMACTTISGSALLVDDIQLGSVTASSGIGWNSSGVVDLRSLWSHERLIIGNGLTSVITAGANTIALSLTPPALTYVQVTPVLTSALIPCNSGAAGTMATVTDALTPTYLGTLTGGSTVKCPVYCNGTAWITY